MNAGDILAFDLASPFFVFLLTFLVHQMSLACSSIHQFLVVDLVLRAQLHDRIRNLHAFLIIKIIE
jgi:hypothetical protein